MGDVGGSIAADVRLAEQIDKHATALYDLLEPLAESIDDYDGKDREDVDEGRAEPSVVGSAIVEPLYALLEEASLGSDYEEAASTLKDLRADLAATAKAYLKGLNAAMAKLDAALARMEGLK